MRSIKLPLHPCFNNRSTFTCEFLFCSNMYFDDSTKPAPAGAPQQFNYPTDNWWDYEELMMALKYGDKSKIEFLLVNGCRVYRPGTFNTPLHLAVEKYGYANIVKRLLKHGAQVHFYNENHDTALHHAFVKGAPNITISRMLMTYVATNHMDLVNSNGITYLHIACAKSKLAYVKKLMIMNNVDVNAQVNRSIDASYAGYTALHFAVQRRKIDIASFLLKNKANIYVFDADGSTPLHLACRLQDIEMIDLLLGYDQLRQNSIDNYNISHFMAACMSTIERHPEEYLLAAQNHYNIPVLTLLSGATSPLFKSCPGYTPLHFAAAWGRLNTVEWLLTYVPSDVFYNVLNAYAETPLMLAQRCRHIEICKLLQTQNLKNFERAMQNHTVDMAWVENTVVKSNLNTTGVDQTVNNENHQDYSSFSNAADTLHHRRDLNYDFGAMLYS